MAGEDTKKTPEDTPLPSTTVAAVAKKDPIPTGRGGKGKGKTSGKTKSRTKKTRSLQDLF